MSLKSMIASLTGPIVQSGDGKVFQFPTNGEAQQFEVSVNEAGGETLRLVCRDEALLLKALQVRQQILPAHQPELVHDLVVCRVADPIPTSAQVLRDGFIHLIPLLMDGIGTDENEVGFQNHPARRTMSVQETTLCLQP